MPYGATNGEFDNVHGEFVRLQFWGVFLFLFPFFFLERVGVLINDN